jgi:hypothetical protein
MRAQAITDKLGLFAGKRAFAGGNGKGHLE